MTRDREPLRESDTCVLRASGPGLGRRWPRRL